MEFAKNVKAARKKKGLTLDELSELCGVSRSMLSQIEREEKNPTLQIACQISKGLNLTLSQLLGEQDEEEVIVIKKHERYIFKDETSGFERHLLSPTTNSTGIEFILNMIPTGMKSPAFPAHSPGVKEYIYVTQGQLGVELGETPMIYELEVGDSICFNANKKHRFINLGNENCRYFLIIDSNQRK